MPKYSETCLQLLLIRFPQFEPFVRHSNSGDQTWYAELPWPDGWDTVGLMAQTQRGRYGDEFRVDFGNSHAHYGDYEKTGLFDHLEEAFELIDNILNERLVLIAKWIKPREFISDIDEPDYQPEDKDWNLGVQEIWMRSWNATYNKEWRKT